MVSSTSGGGWTFSYSKGPADRPSSGTLAADTGRKVVSMAKVSKKLIRRVDERFIVEPSLLCVRSKKTDEDKLSWGAP